ncbi:activating transcription factor 7-interacting 1 [Chlorella sorokiniana]|uniref:Activating transcription factor 7-interacting 1 n=1 Tax=Chlorella sorokiniana TaxID=3076 RepID=A0A2P6U3H2_CHLSO|nr:activating transcription factor 7-interacting 1 [Chlorella sorokiniana]|eukprot:PRW60863.1 activating transcription factor 7-interacting 1 [Chlorella sorokiniana]
MPDPTPPLQMTLPLEHAATAPSEQPSATARGEEPQTPPGDASGQRGQRIGGGSSSTEEGAGGSGMGDSEAVPLLGDSTGQLAPGLRRRQAHDGSGVS